MTVRTVSSSRWTPGPELLVRLTYGLMRFIIGANFACHGAQKLFGVLGASRETGDPLGLAAGIIEFFGGLLVSVGLLTRPAALIASGEMAVAYFKAHASRGFWPIVNGGEKALLYCFIFLFIAAFGAGAYSLDVLVRARRTR